jgi:hypothetical protein
VKGEPVSKRKCTIIDGDFRTATTSGRMGRSYWPYRMPWMVGRGLLRGDVSERYLDPRSIDILVFKSSSSTSVNRMSNLFADMVLGGTSRGRISHSENGDG